MSTLSSWFTGASVGAGLISLVDSVRGKRRRSIWDKAIHTFYKPETFLDRVGRELKGLGRDLFGRNGFSARDLPGRAREVVGELPGRAREAVGDFPGRARQTVEDLPVRAREVVEQQVGRLPAWDPRKKLEVRQQKEERLTTLPLVFSWFAAAVAGAGLMYLLDPERGNRRRALIRDQAIHTRRKTVDFLDKAGRDLQNRGRGLVAQGRSLFGNDEPSDRVVAARVREAMGLVVSNASAISVTAYQGYVTLRGPILADEVDDLMARLVTVPGVEDIDNQLEVYQEPGDVPALQGAGRAASVKSQFELLQENWTPGIRLLAAIGGGALALGGLKRGGITGLLGSLIGLGLATRSVTNKPLKRLADIDTDRWTGDLRRFINLDVPATEESFASEEPVRR